MSERELTMSEALNEALHEEMRRDGKVLVIGEDIADMGGLFQVTAGLLEQFGSRRVIDSPISEEMEYGTIARWLKTEGDAVTRGEVIVEIDAEKVVQEVEAPVAGVLESILAIEGDEIRVGATIAVIAEGPE